MYSRSPLSIITAPSLASFRGELTKIARINPALGAGATLATLGGLGVGTKDYLQSRAEGKGVGESLGSAAQGALMGAGAGGAVGAGLGMVSPKSVGGAISRFGQRQLHSVTGWTPKGGIRSIRGGAYDQFENMRSAKKALNEVEGHISGTKPVEGLKELTGDKLTAHRNELKKSLEDATKSYQAARKAEKWGLTSLPGYVSSIKQRGLFPTLGASAAEQLHGTSAATKALTLGLPAYGVASAAMSPDKTDEEGVSKGGRIGERVGQLVGGIAGGAMPLVGQLGVQEGVGRLGKAIGSGVDKFRRAPAQNPTDPLLSTGQNTPSEYVLSSRAGGQE